MCPSLKVATGLFTKTQTILRILIAEDEASVREVLSAMLSGFLPDAQLEEAKDGHQALALATDGSFDVVFLDIEMPGLNGLEVAGRLLGLKEPPRIVFATGKAGHALEAFRLAAFDYVVKPFEPERLWETVQRLLEDSDHSQRQRQSFGRIYEHPEIPQIWAEVAEDSWVLLDYSAIQWVEAAGRAVTLHTREHPPLKVKQTLKELESRLKPHGFVRVHKAYIVNTGNVERMRAWFSGSFILVMGDANSTEIPLSRRYAADFKKATGWS
jgi:DNA-binding LytR/AlgR family response regulator